MYGYVGTIRELEQRLVAVEAQISELRSEQLVLVGELDRAQAPQSDASRSLEEWVQSHLDVKGDTARDLVFAARRFGYHRGLHNRMLYGSATFDRTVVAVRLADTGATMGEIEESYMRDLDGVGRMIARTRRVTVRDERDMFAGRFFTIQPNLDESRYRMWGEAPGAIGRRIDKAICARADQLHRTAGGLPSTRSQRQLDAFAAIAQDSLEGTSRGESDSPLVTVFVDARREDPAETAAVVEYGPRVGPNTLEQLLCTGRVRVVGLDDSGVPVVTSAASRAIPPGIRDVVAYRDGVCVIDGCASRYRLEPHHVRRFADGGDHHPDNLATTCWYHHHIAIHGNGYRIDPDSPPLRRRLIRGSPTRRPDPP